MLFHTQAFLLLFLPVVVSGWYAVSARPELRIGWLIVCSLVFYGWWDVRFIPLLLGQCLLTWIAVETYFRTGKRHASIIVLAIAANLGCLVFFKYLGFLIETYVLMTGHALAKPGIILPVGISFYTFELVSYLADVKWNNAPRYGLLRFLLFVLLFPRLIAGPIVRHHEIIHQFELDPRRPGLPIRLGRGMLWLVVGLVKKVFIADALAPYADAGFLAAAAAPPPLLSAWSAVLAFTFQLFLDFSAYSEMAIGIALMLGLSLPQNFDAPYRATSLRDFWRRWHVTLSRFLRDYLYIPLGGSRSGQAAYFAAILTTMTACGLWHGAGFTFIAWGALHGLGLIVNRAWTGLGWRLPQVVAWAITFLFVMLGWALFRAPTFATAANMIAGLAGLGGLGGTFAGAPVAAIGAFVSLAGPTTAQWIESLETPSWPLAYAAALAAVAIILVVGAGQPADFIYFQF